MARLDVHSIRREQILDAAEHLVAEHGWAQTTFAEICQAAHISNGVLTYHFSGKDDLLLALFERVARRWRERFAIEFATDRTVEEKIAAAVAEAVRRSDEEREFYLLLLHYLARATSHPEIARRLAELFAETRGLFQQEIAQSVAGGAARRVEPDVAAGVIQCLFLGLGLGRAALGIDLPPDRFARDVTEMVQAYLAPI